MAFDAKARTLKEEINEATSRKKPRVFRREIRTAQEILAMTGRESHFSMICAASLSLFCVGGSLAILMGNYFLAPVLAVGFLFFPFWYVRLTAGITRRTWRRSWRQPVHHYHSVFEE